MSHQKVAPPGLSIEGADFEVREVHSPRVIARFRRSADALAPLFRGDEVLCTRIGSTRWYLGRSADWSRHVVGSSALWADIDILPLGLGSHPRYYAMGGLPGTPPQHHRRIRRAAAASSVRAGTLDDKLVLESMALAIRLASDSRVRGLDVKTFARAYFLHLTATTVAGIHVDDAQVRTILSWFDRWTKAISHPMMLLGHPEIPGTPAAKLHQVLREWYDWLSTVLSGGEPAHEGFVARIREQVTAGAMSSEEAVGYLATMLFAGTEPPAHTLIWAHAFCTAHVDDGLAVSDAAHAEALVWEAFRVRPAVNVIVRRLAGEPYRSASPDVYVVVPPLSHHRSNERHELPATFTPALAGRVQLDPNDYPGLGTGVHHCLGARIGMQGASAALAFLLRESRVIEPPDLRPSGLVTTEPRRLPVVTL